MSNLLIILTVLSSFLANLAQKTLQTDFVVSVSEDATQPMNYPGTITIHAQRFVLTMYGLEAAYDGKTLYMYSANTDELTISNPSEQELVSANPFLYAETATENSSITEHPSDDGLETIITLTPNDLSAGINRFTLRVRNADLMPLHLEIKEGKKLSSLTLLNPAFIVTEPTYTIEPEGSTFVNDLRF